MFKKISNLSFANVDEAHVSDVECCINSNKEDQETVKTDLISLHSVPEFANLDKWQKVAKQLEEALGNAVYQSWLQHIKYKCIESTTIVLTAPSKFIKDLIFNNYFTVLRNILLSHYVDVTKIDIQVVKQKLRRIDAIHNETAITPPLAISNEVATLSSNLNNLLTFDNFIYGTSNKAAYFSIKQIADLEELKEETGIVPLFKSAYIHSEAGMGKTHLLQALGNDLIKGFKSKICYLTAEKFTNLYVTAVRQNRLSEFKQSLSNLDVLMIDDFQFICGRSGTEKEFINTFDTLIDSNKKVIIACDRPSQNLDLAPRTKSRMSCCLSIKIEKPEFDLKLKILQHKLKFLYGNSYVATQIKLETLEYIANHVNSSVRELESVLQKIITYCELMGLNFSSEILHSIINENQHIEEAYGAKSCIEGASSGANASHTQFQAILKAVCDDCKVPTSAVLGTSRNLQTSKARQMVAFLAQKLTLMGLTEIGKRLGNRDHSTVVYLINKVKNASDSLIPEQIKRLIDIIR